MDIRCYPRDFIEDFINLYREQECLWNTKSPDYNHKIKRRAAYDKLLVICKTADANANKASVVRKINSLRASWRRSKRKHESEKSGNATEEYTPRLWYYPLLSFLEEHFDPHPTESNINIVNENTNNSSTSNNILPETDYESSQTEEEILFLPAASTPRRTQTQSRQNQKRPYSSNRVEEVLELIDNKIRTTTTRSETTRSEDDYDILGKYIANKMRKLPDQMKIITEKLINDLFFHAQVGNLNFDSVITTSNVNSNLNRTALNSSGVERVETKIELNNGDRRYS